ncbi:MAG: hypothetical protein PVH61_00150 [Candidatus Aminicenantes bacterium]|jgi:hypothetical protein
MPISSGFWKKSSNSGIFGGGHKKNPFGHDHDPMMDEAQEWDELEGEYYKDFDRRIANPVDHQFRHEDHPQDKNQAENSARSDKFRDKEETEGQETPVDNTGTSTGGTPYREGAMKVTDIRRGGHKRLTDLMSNRFSKSLINRPISDLSKNSKPPPDTLPVDCPESGGQVGFCTCVQCSKFQEWDERDGGPRCYHEYKEMKDRGDYENMVGDPPSEEELEHFSQEVDKERLRLEKKGPSKELKEARQATKDFYKFMWGDPVEHEEDEGDFYGDQDYDDDNDYDNQEEYY